MTTSRSDDPRPRPAWATTQTLPYAAPADSAPTTAPAVNPPTWSGRKAAVAASLAIGVSSTRGADGSSGPTLLKDFSAIPVCGSVRPSASQRGLRRQPGR